MSVTVSFRLGRYSAAVERRIAAWTASSIGKRIWAKDPAVWFDRPVDELVDRLGWLDLPTTAPASMPALAELGAALRAEGIRHAIVLGMGGSSLAPEVFQATLGNAPGFPEVRILDSTHPAAVRAVENATDPARTLYIVSSKSGTTLETLSFMRYFWSRTAEAVEQPGSRFVAVTDPGSSLEAIAEERSFRATFLAPPDVGGRYSALTPFGLVPAAAMGADVARLLAASAEMADACGPDIAEPDNPGLQLGAALGELANAGRNKVTFSTSASFRAFPAWIEQLIAESTGKNGKGIVPVGGEPITSPDGYGDDRVFVHIGSSGDDGGPAIAGLADAGHPVVRIALDAPEDLGAAMFLWELAVATAGSVLGIHPFDQPDVQLAKELARQAMAGEATAGEVTEIEATDPALTQRVTELLSHLGPGGYMGIHVYLPPVSAARDPLEVARMAVRDARGVATTLDFGPRFLHSTGQLHKGGPDTGVFIQVVDHPPSGVAVPETDYDFARLITAQAIGDHRALRDRNRPVLMICTGDRGLGAVPAVRDAIVRAARG